MTDTPASASPNIWAIVGSVAFAALSVQALRQRMAAKKNAQAEAVAAHPKKLVFKDANLPMDAEGRVYHLNTKAGEVANRIVSVGDAGRAERISALMDGGKPSIKVTASRGFVTHTGTYKGVPVSIIATGMGYPMMDFVIRETRCIIDGPVAMIRYGTCGGLRATVGNIVVHGDGAALVRRDPDRVAALIEKGVDTEDGHAKVADEDLPYNVSKMVKPNADLSGLLLTEMDKSLKAADLGSKVKADASEAKPDFKVLKGADASGCSFYSSQGRTNSSFYDYNAGLVNYLERTFPELLTLEMETFHLFDLARASREHAKIHAAGAAIVLADRHSKAVVSKEDMITLECVGGKAVLEAITQFQL